MSNENSNTKKPPSEKQLAANRANAQKSTGPKTEEGKSASRNNALKHGMCSRRTILPHEDESEYASIREGLIAAWNPANDQELQLIDHIAFANWRQLRAQAVECSIFELQIAFAKSLGRKDPNTHDEDFKALGLGFVKEARYGFEKLFKYDGQSNRHYYRAVEQLRKIQADRFKQEQLQLPANQPNKQPAEDPEPSAPEEKPKVLTAGTASQAEQTTTQTSENGFVASNKLSADLPTSPSVASESEFASCTHSSLPVCAAAETE